MRAPLLIILGITFIVSLQASYLVVNASGHHHKARSTSKQDEEEEIQTNELYKYNWREDPDVVHKGKYEDVPSYKMSESIPAHKIIPAEQISEIDIEVKETNDTLPKSMDVILEEGKYKTQDENDIYYGMQGDSPIPSDDKETARDERKMERKEARRVMRKEERKEQRKEARKEHRKTNRKDVRKSPCERDADCNGGCCVEARDGERFCKSSHNKGANKRCMTSCSCKDDMECFVVNREIEARKKKGKKLRKIMGRCVKREDIHINAGYFITESPPKDNTI